MPTILPVRDIYYSNITKPVLVFITVCISGIYASVGDLASLQCIEYLGPGEVPGDVDVVHGLEPEKDSLCNDQKSAE